MDTVTNECSRCLWKKNAIAWHENFNKIYAENQELKREIERLTHGFIDDYRQTIAQLHTKLEDKERYIVSKENDLKYTLARAEDLEKQVVAYRNDLAESNHFLQNWQKRYTEIKDKYNELIAKERREFYLPKDKYIYVKNLSYGSAIRSGYEFRRDPSDNFCWLKYIPQYEEIRSVSDGHLVDAIPPSAIMKCTWEIRIPR